MKLNLALGIAIVRIVLGITFLVHGVDKLLNMQGTINWFESIGFHQSFAFLVAVTETVAGLGLILGIASRQCAAAVAIILMVALLRVKLASPFLGGYEFDIALLSMAILIMLDQNPQYRLNIEIKN